MDFVLSYPLSLNTLSATFILPFLYFVYQTKYWFLPEALRRLDFFLQVTAIILLGLVAAKLPHLKDAPWPELHLALLHLVAPGLTILIASKTRLERWLHAQQGTSQNGKTAAKKVEKFRPMPAGKEIERLFWDDIVISQDLKEELNATINLLRKPKEARRYGIEVPKGMLFYGPPGTGKTTIAKVLANTAGLSFFALKMDEVVSKWVGESEKNLSALFKSAIRHAPAVIFIDEIDAIGRSRSGKGHEWAENLLNHLLQLIDGVAKTEGLYVIGATNRVELVDAALKRAGRLNKVIEIPLPDYPARIQLFNQYLSRLKVEEQVSIEELASVTEGCSGADIKEICNQAGLNAFKRESHGTKRDYSVSIPDLQMALNEFSGPHAERQDIHTAQQ